MRGLIIKDMYILKKHIRTFIFVSVGVMVLGILFALSSRYGNVADKINDIKAQGGKPELIFEMNMCLIWAVIIIPMAFAVMVEHCFIKDSAAGFGKVAGALPLSNVKIVASRYITSIVISLISLAVSFFVGAMVTVASTGYSYKKVVCCTAFIFSVLVIYNAIVMPLYYFFGGNKAGTIMIIPFIVAYVAAGAAIMNLADEKTDRMISSLPEKIDGFVNKNAWVFLLVATAAMLISFGISCAIRGTKEGVQ